MYVYIYIYTYYGNNGNGKNGGQGYGNSYYILSKNNIYKYAYLYSMVSFPINVDTTGDTMNG